MSLTHDITKEMATGKGVRWSVVLSAGFSFVFAILMTLQAMGLVIITHAIGDADEPHFAYIHLAFVSVAAYWLIFLVVDLIECHDEFRVAQLWMQNGSTLLLFIGSQIISIGTVLDLALENGFVGRGGTGYVGWLMFFSGFAILAGNLLFKHEIAHAQK